MLDEGLVADATPRIATERNCFGSLGRPPAEMENEVNVLIAADMSYHFGDREPGTMGKPPF